MADNSTDPPLTFYPPFHVISDTDKRGLIIVITSVTLSFIISALLIRIYIRLNTSWKLDDFLLLAATVVASAESGVVYSLVNDGFGTAETLAEDETAKVFKTAYAVDLLYILGLFLSKCAIMAFFFRLTPDAIQRLLVRVTLGASALWAFISILLISIDCGVGRDVKCSHLFLRWQVIGALDIITEITIFANAIYLVVGLQMSLRLQSFVVFAFSLRLPVIAASAARLYYKHKETIATHGTIEASYTLVWSQLELDYSIIASTISILGPFLTPFMRSTGSSGSRSNGHQGHSIVSRSRNIHLQTFSSRSARDDHIRRVNDTPAFRKDLMFNTTNITHTLKSDQRSLGSTSSQQMIITKKTDWKVESIKDGERGSVLEKNSD